MGHPGGKSGLEEKKGEEDEDVGCQKQGVGNGIARSGDHNDGEGAVFSKRTEEGVEEAAVEGNAEMARGEDSPYTLTGAQGEEAGSKLEYATNVSDPGMAHDDSRAGSSDTRSSVQTNRNGKLDSEGGHDGDAKDIGKDSSVNSDKPGSNTDNRCAEDPDGHNNAPGLIADSIPHRNVGNESANIDLGTPNSSCVMQSGTISMISKGRDDGVRARVMGMRVDGGFGNEHGLSGDCNSDSCSKPDLVKADAAMGSVLSVISECCENVKDTSTVDGECGNDNDTSVMDDNLCRASNVSGAGCGVQRRGIRLTGERADGKEAACHMVEVNADTVMGTVVASLICESEDFKATGALDNNVGTISDISVADCLVIREHSDRGGGQVADCSTGVFSVNGVGTSVLRDDSEGLASGDGASSGKVDLAGVACIRSLSGENVASEEREAGSGSVQLAKRINDKDSVGCCQTIPDASVALPVSDAGVAPAHGGIPTKGGIDADPTAVGENEESKSLEDAADTLLAGMNSRGASRVTLPNGESLEQTKGPGLNVAKAALSLQTIENGKNAPGKAAGAMEVADANESEKIREVAAQVRDGADGTATEDNPTDSMEPVSTGQKTGKNEAVLCGKPSQDSAMVCLGDDGDGDGGKEQTAADVAGAVPGDTVEGTVVHGDRFVPDPQQLMDPRVDGRDHACGVDSSGGIPLMAINNKSSTGDETDSLRDNSVNDRNSCGDGSGGGGGGKQFSSCTSSVNDGDQVDTSNVNKTSAGSAGKRGSISYGDVDPKQVPPCNSSDSQMGGDGVSVSQLTSGNRCERGVESGTGSGAAMFLGMAVAGSQEWTVLDVPRVEGLCDNALSADAMMQHGFAMMHDDNAIDSGDGVVGDSDKCTGVEHAHCGDGDAALGKNGQTQRPVKSGSRGTCLTGSVKGFAVDSAGRGGGSRNSLCVEVARCGDDVQGAIYSASHVEAASVIHNDGSAGIDSIASISTGYFSDSCRGQGKLPRVHPDDAGNGVCDQRSLGSNEAGWNGVAGCAQDAGPATGICSDDGGATFSPNGTVNTGREALQEDKATSGHVPENNDAEARGCSGGEVTNRGSSVGMVLSLIHIVAECGEGVMKQGPANGDGVMCHNTKATEQGAAVNGLVSMPDRKRLCADRSEQVSLARGHAEPDAWRHASAAASSSPTQDLQIVNCQTCVPAAAELASNADEGAHLEGSCVTPSIGDSAIADVDEGATAQGRDVLDEGKSALSAVAVSLDHDVLVMGSPTQALGGEHATPFLEGCRPTRNAKGVDEGEVRLTEHGCIGDPNDGVAKGNDDSLLLDSHAPLRSSGDNRVRNRNCMDGAPCNEDGKAQQCTACEVVRPSVLALPCSQEGICDPSKSATGFSQPPKRNDGGLVGINGRHNSVTCDQIVIVRQHRAPGAEESPEAGTSGWSDTVVTACLNESGTDFHASKVKEGELVCAVNCADGAASDHKNHAGNGHSGNDGAAGAARSLLHYTQIDRHHSNLGVHCACKPGNHKPLNDCEFANDGAGSGNCIGHADCTGGSDADCQREDYAAVSLTGALVKPTPEGQDVGDLKVFGNGDTGNLNSDNIGEGDRRPQPCSGGSGTCVAGSYAPDVSSGSGRESDASVAGIIDCSEVCADDIPMAVDGCRDTHVPLVLGGQGDSVVARLTEGYGRSSADDGKRNEHVRGGGTPIRYACNNLSGKSEDLCDQKCNSTGQILGAMTEIAKREEKPSGVGGGQDDDLGDDHVATHAGEAQGKSDGGDVGEDAGCGRSSGPRPVVKDDNAGEEPSSGGGGHGDLLRDCLSCHDLVISLFENAECNCAANVPTGETCGRGNSHGLELEFDEAVNRPPVGDGCHVATLGNGLAKSHARDSEKEGSASRGEACKSSCSSEPAMSVDRPVEDSVLQGGDHEGGIPQDCCIFGDVVTSSSWDAERKSQNSDIQQNQICKKRMKSNSPEPTVKGDKAVEAPSLVGGTVEYVPSFDPFCISLGGDPEAKGAVDVHPCCEERGDLVSIIKAEESIVEPSVGANGILADDSPGISPENCGVDVHTRRECERIVTPVQVEVANTNVELAPLRAGDNVAVLRENPIFDDPATSPSRIGADLDVLPGCELSTLGAGDYDEAADTKFLFVRVDDRTINPLGHDGALGERRAPSLHSCQSRRTKKHQNSFGSIEHGGAGSLCLHPDTLEEVPRTGAVASKDDSDNVSVTTHAQTPAIDSASAATATAAVMGNVGGANGGQRESDLIFNAGPTCWSVNTDGMCAPYVQPANRQHDGGRHNHGSGDSGEDAKACVAGAASELAYDGVAQESDIPTGGLQRTVHEERSKFCRTGVELISNSTGRAFVGENGCGKISNGNVGSGSESGLEKHVSVNSVGNGICVQRSRGKGLHVFLSVKDTSAVEGGQKGGLGQTGGCCSVDASQRMLSIAPSFSVRLCPSLKDGTIVINSRHGSTVLSQAVENDNHTISGRDEKGIGVAADDGDDGVEVRGECHSSVYPVARDLVSVERSDTKGHDSEAAEADQQHELKQQAACTVDDLNKTVSIPYKFQLRLYASSKEAQAAAAHCVRSLERNRPAIWKQIGKNRRSKSPGAVALHSMPIYRSWFQKSVLGHVEKGHCEVDVVVEDWEGSRWGMTWHHRKSVLLNGWANLMNFHSLAFGDFIVFETVGPSLLKIYAFCIGDEEDGHGAIQEQDGDGEYRCGKRLLEARKRLRQAKRRKAGTVTHPYQQSPDSGLHQSSVINYEHVHLSACNNEGESSGHAMRFISNKGIVAFKQERGAGASLVTETHIDTLQGVGDDKAECRRSNRKRRVKSTVAALFQKKMRVEKEREENKDDVKEHKDRKLVDQYVTLRRPILQEERKAVMEKVEAFVSDYPTFSCKMTPSVLRNWLRIPKAFMSLLPQGSGDVTFIGPNGYRCKLGWLWSPDKRCGFSSGWRQFIRDQELQDGDWIVLEFLKQTVVRVNLFPIVCSSETCAEGVPLVETWQAVPRGYRSKDAGGHPLVVRGDNGDTAESVMASVGRGSRGWGAADARPGWAADGALEADPRSRARELDGGMAAEQDVKGRGRGKKQKSNHNWKISSSNVGSKVSKTEIQKNVGPCKGGRRQGRDEGASDVGGSSSQKSQQWRDMVEAGNWCEEYREVEVSLGRAENDKARTGRGGKFSNLTIQRSQNELVLRIVGTNCLTDQSSDGIAKGCTNRRPCGKGKLQASPWTEERILVGDGRASGKKSRGKVRGAREESTRSVDEGGRNKVNQVVMQAQLVENEWVEDSKQNGLARVKNEAAGRRELDNTAPSGFVDVSNARFGPSAIDGKNDKKDKKRKRKWRFSSLKTKRRRSLLEKMAKSTDEASCGNQGFVLGGQSVEVTEIAAEHASAGGESTRLVRAKKTDQKTDGQRIANMRRRGGEESLPVEERSVLGTGMPSPQVVVKKERCQGVVYGSGRKQITEGNSDGNLLMSTADRRPRRDAKERDGRPKDQRKQTYAEVRGGEQGPRAPRKHNHVEENSSVGKAEGRRSLVRGAVEDRGISGYRDGWIGNGQGDDEEGEYFSVDRMLNVNWGAGKVLVTLTGLYVSGDSSRYQSGGIWVPKEWLATDFSRVFVPQSWQLKSHASAIRGW